LFSKTEQGYKAVKKMVKRSQTIHSPYTTYWCLCRGYPLVDNISRKESGQEGVYREHVVIHLKEVDELGDYKEPEILSVISKTKLKKEEKFYKPAVVDLKIIASNKNLYVSVLEISSTQYKWHFFRTFAASKA